MQDVPARLRRFDHDFRQFAENLDVASFKSLAAPIGAGKVSETKAPNERLAGQRPGASRAGPPRAAPYEAAAPNRPFRPGPSISAGEVQADWRQLSRNDEQQQRHVHESQRRAEPSTNGPSRPSRRELKALKALKKKRNDDAQNYRAPAEPARVPRQKPGKMGFERRILAIGLDMSFVAAALATAVALVTVLAAVRGSEVPDHLADWLALAPLAWLLQFNPYQILAGVYAMFFAYQLLFRVVAGGTFGEILLRRGAWQKNQEISGKAREKQFSSPP